jgi:geranylgeranyl pyrophosphate synthase
MPRSAIPSCRRAPADRLDDVIDLSDDPGETGKVPGTDLRAGVPTMPYLLLGRAADHGSGSIASIAASAHSYA